MHPTIVISAIEAVMFVGVKTGSGSTIRVCSGVGEVEDVGVRVGVVVGPESIHSFASSTVENNGEIYVSR